MPYSCSICPHNCRIPDGGFGRCGVRGCRDGRLYLPYHGILSAASNDPVEKKPLYHFHPGESIFSIGFYGCNLSCPFCQNYHISKEFGEPSSSVTSPEKAAERALSEGSFGIAYTYSEPVVHYEWVLETAKAAHRLGLKNVMVTNGFINPGRADALLEHIDALNIDLKSFNDDFYRRELRGSLEPVLEFIRKAAAVSHVEATTLVIPGKNDGEDEISSCSKFLSSVDPDIPYHLSAYYPTYNYSVPPTSSARLTHLADLASEDLNFVYTGNIAGGRTDTFCPDCGTLLISRSGYSTQITGLSSDSCENCGRKIIG